MTKNQVIRELHYKNPIMKQDHVFDPLRLSCRTGHSSKPYILKATSILRFCIRNIGMLAHADCVSLFIEKMRVSQETIC